MAKLPIDTSASATDMANAMFGSGITVSNATISGVGSQSGTFSDGDTIAPNATPSDTGVILSTGHADHYTNSGSDVNVSTQTSTGFAGPGDAGIDALTGGANPSFDAVVFEADFVPVGTLLKLDLIFASEEYLEYVGDIFEDAIGVWINGVYAPVENIAGGIININTVNDATNSSLFIDNTGDLINTEMDGVTTPLTISGPVNPGVTNTIRIVIADVGDNSLDSAILISGNSIVSVCFVAGTALLTPSGYVPVDALSPGDLVETMDNGAQPLRWIGKSRLPNTPGNAPICFPVGALGNTSPLGLSPQHRVMLKSLAAETLFDKSEVFVAAKHLADHFGASSPESGRTVYYHVLFDRHEIVFAAGAPCESLHVGNMSLIGMSRRTTAALRQAVPTIAEQPGALARPAIRRFEFEALVRLDPAITGQAPPGLPPTSQHEPRRRPRLRVVS